jgi:transposase
MIDITELYRYLLGIEAPWEVTGIELSEHEGRVDVSVGHPSRTRFPCPECGTELSVYDHTEDRAWRHLDSCGCLTYLHARTPRVTCLEHGTVQVRLPWAEPLSRFTTRFESWAVDQLSECSVTGAGRLLRTSWDETWGLMARAVARGQAVKEPSAPQHVGVDEKSVGHGQDYITVVSDLDRSTVEHIADERRQSSLDSYFDTLTAALLQSIKAVAMDMWEPYVNSVRAHLTESYTQKLWIRVKRKAAYLPG